MGPATKKMNYSLSILWHERSRFLPGILAVSFSAVLIALQCGLLLGLFSITSIPIDHTRADIWVGAPDLLSVDVTRPIPESYAARLASQPEVERTEIYIQSFAQWIKPTGGAELCIIIGSRLEDDSMGSIEELTPQLRGLLTEPGAIVVDESEQGRLGIHGIGATGEISGHRVRVVGFLKRLQALAGPYIFCSIQTARMLTRLNSNQASYILARCHNPADATKVVDRLRGMPEMSSFTSSEFSFRSRMHWLLKTKAGIALGYAALLGLLVGAVVTSQTLYAATAASMREYAVLQAMGIPRWRMAMAVLSQSFWVGIFGVLLAFPTVFALAQVADTMGVNVILKWWLLAGAGGVTLIMAILAGLYAMRSLRLVEPAILLR
jgi:putative ABC transport system permease protein